MSLKLSVLGGTKVQFGSFSRLVWNRHQKDLYCIWGTISEYCRNISFRACVGEIPTFVQGVAQKRRSKKSGKIKVEKWSVFDTFQKVKAKVKHFSKKCKNTALSTPVGSHDWVCKTGLFTKRLRLRPIDLRSFLVGGLFNRTVISTVPGAMERIRKTWKISTLRVDSLVVFQESRGISGKS